MTNPKLEKMTGSTIFLEAQRARKTYSSILIKYEINFIEREQGFVAYKIIVAYWLLIT